MYKYVFGGEGGGEKGWVGGGVVLFVCFAKINIYNSSHAYQAEFVAPQRFP